MRYSKPTELSTAIALLRERDHRALAGGTDLLVRLGREQAWPTGLVDIKAIPELCILRHEGDALLIGAGLPLSELIAGPELRDYPALIEACRVFAARQIRERATLGGNLANASPAADGVPSLIAYDAVCCTNLRKFPVEDLAEGPGRTCLAADEIILHLSLPRPADTARSFFHKLAGRDAMAIAVASVAGCIVVEGGETRLARLALGSVAPTVIRARGAESELVGRPLNADRIRAAARAAMDEASPIDDIRGSAGYRKRMIGRLLEYELSRILAAH